MDEFFHDKQNLKNYSEFFEVILRNFMLQKLNIF